MAFQARLRRLLPGLWAGCLLCVAGLATPAPFALLARAEAGRVAGRVLAGEAATSLALGVLLLVLHRAAAQREGAPQFGWDFGLVLGALACTVAGYYALLPLMEAARAGAGGWSFVQLHAISAAFYALKVLLVLALAWRAARDSRPAA